MKTSVGYSARLQKAVRRPTLQDWITARDTYLRCGTRLVRVVTVILQSNAEAEDVVSEAMYSLAIAMPTIRNREPAALDVWLKTTVAREAISRRRRLGRLVSHGTVMDIELLWNRAAPNLPTEDQVMAKRALDVIATLPPKQRTAYLARHYLDLTLEQVAQAMGCSTGNVHTHLQRAQKKINAELGDGSSAAVTHTRSRRERRQR